MSRSEAQALGLVAEAVTSGVMSDREAQFWREAVRDPCGCREGLILGVVAAVGTTLSRPGAMAPVLVRGVAGFVVGALSGKVYGVAQGLRLVRHQRAELAHRVAALEVPTDLDVGALSP